MKNVDVEYFLKKKQKKLNSDVERYAVLENLLNYNEL